MALEPGDQPRPGWGWRGEGGTASMAVCFHIVFGMPEFFLGPSRARLQARQEEAKSGPV